MNCDQLIPSNDVIDIIISRDEQGRVQEIPDCIQTLDGPYDLYYYKRERVPPLSIREYSYSSIPKCLGLLDTTALEVSGIIQLQNQSALSLRGQGVLVGFIDTGIAYENACFRNPDGSTRITAIWDQTGEQSPPQGYLYGTEYTKEQINAALVSDDPRGIVPQTDENGHGTFLASIACGSEDAPNNFVGAVPESDILVVKLKPAKPYLRNFFYIPEEAAVYQENDVMAAIDYLDRKARELGKPLVVCVALGMNNGSHAGSGVLSDYLNYVGGLWQRCVVVATGNEANARHHFMGESTMENPSTEMEISLEKPLEGFYLELWANAPELFSVGIRAPGGSLYQPSVTQLGGHQEHEFYLENTRVEIDYRTVGRTRGDQLIFIRFDRPTRGIWTVYVYPDTTITGRFHAWLPMTGMLPENVIFLEPDPDTTLTTPSSAYVPITVGGYNAADGALYLESGRGYTTMNSVKPDFTAPAVNVQGVGLRGIYMTGSGTSIAAAITSGACAQVLEWGLRRERAIGLNSAEIGNILIRGCERDKDRVYPNSQWGYGRLNVYNAFRNL